jgi:hypothetical protein
MRIAGVTRRVGPTSNSEMPNEVAGNLSSTKPGKDLRRCPDKSIAEVVEQLAEERPGGLVVLPRLAGLGASSRTHLPGWLPLG